MGFVCDFFGFLFSANLASFQRVKGLFVFVVILVSFLDNLIVLDVRVSFAIASRKTSKVGRRQYQVDHVGVAVGIGVENGGDAAGVDVLDRLKALDAKPPILYFKFTVSLISSVIQT